MTRPLDRFSRDRRDARNARRQRLALHLHNCGPRPTLEALLDVAGGRDLDETLEDFARLSATTYEAVGASDLPLNSLRVIKGGRQR
jgi:hypothetical protein